MAFFSKADFLFYGGAAGGGKLMCVFTKIPCINGWTTMGDIKVGDVIFDEKGNQCNVTVVEPITTDKTYVLKFSDGSEITAGASHKWVTETYQDRTNLLKLSDEWRKRRRKKRPSRSKGKRPDVIQKNINKVHVYKEIPLPTVKTTQEIVDTLLIGKRINHSIPVCGPINLPHIDLPLDPYVLGAWLGDGTSIQGSITGLDNQIFDEIRKAGFTVTDRSVIKHKGILKLRPILRKIGVFGNKHIPSIYLRSSIEQRLSLLHGLMDTDGTCNTRGQCEFDNTNKILIDQVRELICSLGIKVTVTEGIARLNGKDYGPKYRLKFITDLPAFRLKRKLARQNRDDFRGTHRRRYIVSATLVDSVQMRCIAVDSPSHLYLAGESFIPTHNTDLMLGVAYHNHTNAVLFRRTAKQLRGIVKRANILFRKHGGFNKSEGEWQFNKGSALQFGSMQYLDDAHNWQGIPHDCFLFDELTSFLEYQVRFVTGWLRPDDHRNVTGRTRIIGAGNPPVNAEGYWVIPFFAPWLDRNHPNPAKPGELRYFISLEGKDTEVDSPEPTTYKGEILNPRSRTFIPAKVEDNIFLMKAGYKDALQALPEPLRSKMLQGDFSAGMKDGDWQIIPTEWILAAQQRWKNKSVEKGPLTAIGVDVARGGDDNTILTPKHGNWYEHQLVYPGTSTPNGDYVKDLIFKIYQRGAIPYIDAIGVGAAAYDATRKLIPETIALQSAGKSNATDRSYLMNFGNKRAEWWWKFREALDPEYGDNIALPPDDELKADLTAPNFYVKDNVIWVEDKDQIKKRLGRSPDKGDSCVYASSNEASNVPSIMTF